MKLVEQLGPQHLAPASQQLLHPVLTLMLERQQGQPDDRKLALAIEGGGMRGIISAGMCIALEQLDLVRTFDLIVGTSSGALNGSFTATGQGRLGCTSYFDSASRQFSSYSRLFKAKRPINFDYLFNEVIDGRKPYSEAGFTNGLEFNAIATSVKTRQARHLQNFDSAAEMALAVKASCALPYFSSPVIYRGDTLIDGSLLAPIPYQQAREAGATDVLVLRTRPAEYRKSGRPGRYPSAASIASLLGQRNQIYNHQAQELAVASNRQGNLFQLTPTNSELVIGHTEKSTSRLAAGLQAGISAVTHAFGIATVEAYSQPMLYLTQ